MTLPVDEFKDVTIADMVACARREIAQRERVYGRWVEAGRMTAMQAQRETRRMKAILRNLEAQETAGRLL